MRPTAFTLLSVLGTAASNAVRDRLPRDGCSSSLGGDFEISVGDGKGGKRDVAHKQRPACSGDGILVASLSDGILRDAKGRTGYISADHQLQFDNPPQENAIFTSGFSACDTGLLALRSSTDFYKCKSGPFYNLYDRHTAEQCSQVEIRIVPCGGDDGRGGDGRHVAGSEVEPATMVVTRSDGQVQVATTEAHIPICQIGDGQIQAHTTLCIPATVELEPTPHPQPPVVKSSDGSAPPPPPPPPVESSEQGPIGTPSTPPPEPAPSTTAYPTSGGTGGLNSSTTLHTTGIPPHIPSHTQSAAPTTVSVPASGAGSVEVGFVAAFAVGVLGAALFF